MSWLRQSWPERTARTRLERRSPWGPPWWVYGLAFAIANGARQVALVVLGLQPPLLLGVGSWALTGLLVVAVVNLAARAQRTRRRCRLAGCTR